MSRIIVTRYDNGQDHLVVGWDHPVGGAFWQEFNREPDPDPKTGEVNYPDDWQEMKRFDGYMPGIPFDKFPDAVPDDLKPLLVTMEIGKLIEAHWKDPDSGRTVVDLSDQHERTTVNA